MRVDVKFDIGRVSRLAKLTEKQVAFAAVNGINATAKRIQGAMHTRAERIFTVRNRKFLLRQVAIIKPFANVKQGRAFAEIAVGQRARLLLSEFERGGVRRPFKGSKVAVPITGSPARPTFGATVPKDFQIRELKLRKGRKVRGKGGGRKGSTRGLRDTYVVPAIGVYQADGSPGDGGQILYAFVAAPSLDARLQFAITASAIAERWLDDEIEREITKSVIHAAGRS